MLPNLANLPIIQASSITVILTEDVGEKRGKLHFEIKRSRFLDRSAIHVHFHLCGRNEAYHPHGTWHTLVLGIQCLASELVRKQ